MQIVSVRVLEGPNIYSYRPVIRIKLDLGRYDNVPSSSLPGFTDRLTTLLPGLNEHYCSRGYQGGFVERLHEGTYLAHIFEHTALELQRMSGSDVSFGKARSTSVPGLYDVIIGFHNKQAGIKAVYMTEKILVDVLSGQATDVEKCVKTIRQAGEEFELGPSTAAIYRAAKVRGIPVRRINDENLLVLGYGFKQQRVWATTTGRTGALATDLACDKNLTKHILAEGCIPTPYGTVANSLPETLDAFAAAGGPVVVKPLAGNQGKGVSIGLTSAAEVERAYSLARQFDEKVIIEEYIAGRQYRFCVVNGKMVAAAERIPAHVIGDGKHTIDELVGLVNKDPSRGEGHEKPLTKITIDGISVTVLAKQGFTPQSIPAAEQVVYVRENANLSTGGTAVDVTDTVHPDNIHMVERAARLIGLDIAGIDVVTQDITKPIAEDTGAVIEVNAAPGIRMHHYPSAGQPRDVAGAMVDALFPEGENGRIPIIAITGTNGKTTVTRLISHIWHAAGYKVGMTSTDGIYIDGRCIQAGDTTGPASACTVLADPTVEVAVLETARGGIMRAGLAFDQCDIGIVTNITEDHLGQDGLEDLEGLAYVKSLVVEIVRPDGYSLINADDPYVAAMVNRSGGEIVYFSTEPDNIVIRRHLGIGGKAFFVKENTIYAAQGKTAKPICSVTDIPITFGGIAVHNLQNAVIAAAACYCKGVPLSFIKQGLATFAENPGRLTLMPIGDYRVCIDYGHNPAGYQALINTVRKMGAKRLVGVIAAPGDRRDDVIINVGRIAGYGFDSLYIKEDSDLRGRKRGEVAELLRQGVIDAGMAADNIATILAEEEALQVAMEQALPGDIIVVFYEKYRTVLSTVEMMKKRLEMEQRPPTLTEVSPHVVVAGVTAL